MTYQEYLKEFELICEKIKVASMECKIGNIVSSYHTHEGNIIVVKLVDFKEN